MTSHNYTILEQQVDNAIQTGTKTVLNGEIINYGEGFEAGVQEALRYMTTIVYIPMIALLVYVFVDRWLPKWMDDVVLWEGNSIFKRMTLFSTIKDASLIIAVLGSIWLVVIFEFAGKIPFFETQITTR